jgi:hypothetical protein
VWSYIDIKRPITDSEGSRSDGNSSRANAQDALTVRPTGKSRSADRALAPRAGLPHTISSTGKQDPQSNYLAPLVFPEPTRHFIVEVDLVAEMAIINPFDFFLRKSAETFPSAKHCSEQLPD